MRQDVHFTLLLLLRMRSTLTRLMFPGWNLFNYHLCGQAGYHGNQILFLFTQNRLGRLRGLCVDHFQNGVRLCVVSTVHHLHQLCVDYGDDVAAFTEVARVTAMTHGWRTAGV
uniref:Secreted protein n=1 Tax=Cacopsylla melanoneura TaxID=428564 RepID=A0A8D8TU75_9HEMI